MIFDTFTAANSADGFYSYFYDLINGISVKRVYLIKAGPGSGKSTFMKKVSQKANKKGLHTERIFCSSDTKSLDGVYIKDIETIIIDATAPHSYDMRFPGARDNIIDLSVFWDSNKLQSNKHEIENLFEIISEKYKFVYSLLKAAGQCETLVYNIVKKNINTELISTDIRKILKQNGIMPLATSPVNTDRFLSAFTGNGIQTLSDTTDKLCDEYTVFDDKSNIAHLLLAMLQNYFFKAGYNTLSIHSPLLPESRLEQIIIPELRLGFIAGTHHFSPNLDESKITKKINTKKYIKKECYDSNKNKFIFARKMKNELFNSVYDEMKSIKDTHDELEQYYINAIDFDALNAFTENFIAKIL